MSRLLLSIFFSTFALYALADPDEGAIIETAKRTGYTISEVRKHYTGCDSGITPWMNLCSEYLFVVQDLKLNELYAEVKEHVEKTSAEAKLVNAQRAWIKFRDLTCEYESDGYVGGTLHGGIDLGCKQIQTEARIKSFEDYLQCTNPGCPGEW